MTVAETNSYIQEINKNYERTGLVCALDGYTGDRIVEMFGTTYELNQIASYNQILWLIQGLNAKSIFDLGCGAGSLVNYIANITGMVPGGVDINPIAIQVLKEKVLYRYNENFAVKDFMIDKVTVNQDICHLMELYLFSQEDISNLTINSKYIVVRGSLSRFGNDFFEDRMEKSQTLLAESKQLLTQLKIKPSFLKYAEFGRHVWFLFESHQTSSN